METKDSSIAAILRVATGKFISKNDRESESDSQDDVFSHKETVIHEVKVYVDHIVGICRNLQKGDRVVIGGELRHSRHRSYIILLAPQARFYKVE